MTSSIDRETWARMEQLTADMTTKSAKIRALAEAGIKRADIARFLDIRYQHVRNVLVSAEERRRAEHRAAEREQSPHPAWAQVGPDGRVVIPASFRQALGIEGGGHVLLRLEDGELRIIGHDAAIARAQALVAKHVPEDVSLVDALLAERRAEIEREKRSG